MTVEEVKARVAVIAADKDDNESAHVEQDRLFVDVLRQIAVGEMGPAESALLANTALEVLDIKFDRWFS